MNAVVMPMYRPDVDAMAAHVEHLFGGYLDGYHDGLVELSWTDTQKDEAGRYRLRHARLFGTDQLDDLVAEAARLNAVPMCNVYIGAALRRPDTAPFGRAKDSDAWALTALYADLDEEGAVRAARAVYEGAKPTMVVVTGTAPHTRAQLWWKLEQPATDPAHWESVLRGMAVAMQGDVTVTNPSRVMRLAGSIAWPVKDGRNLVEITSIAPLKAPGQSCYAGEHLEHLFPPVAKSAQSVDTGSTVQHTTNGLGLADKISDGRERYMRDMVVAALISYVGENGTAPSAQELFDEAWPVYERKADLSRAGRGKDEFAEKCRYTVQRFERGEIRGVETLEKAVEVAGRKKVAQQAAPAANGNLPPAAVQQTGIRTTDFVTLLTEEVIEEPDYIEPAFAGPGNFVLIAGPPKAQKSFLLQEMLVACATGGSFLAGTFNVPQPLKVFYLQAEMNRKLLRKRAREMTFLSAQDKALLSTNLIVSERFHMILNEDGVRIAVETIKRDFPDAPPDIIAVDPLANVFDQENENDNAQLMRFLTGRLEAIRQAVNPMACVVLVHHATKKSAEDMARDPFVAIRGASALRGYYDSAIVIFRENEESKARKIHFELRGGDSPDPVSMELAAGRFQKSDTFSVSRSSAEQMLDAIDVAWREGKPLSLSVQTRSEGRYAPLVLSRRFGLNAAAIKNIAEDWLMNGVCAVEIRDAKNKLKGLRKLVSLS